MAVEWKPDRESRNRIVVGWRETCSEYIVPRFNFPQRVSIALTKRERKTAAVKHHHALTLLKE
jgi:hypothetical protein